VEARWAAAEKAMQEEMEAEDLTPSLSKALMLGDDRVAQLSHAQVLVEDSLRNWKAVHQILAAEEEARARDVLNAESPKKRLEEAMSLERTAEQKLLEAEQTAVAGVTEARRIRQSAQKKVKSLEKQCAGLRLATSNFEERLSVATREVARLEKAHQEAEFAAAEAIEALNSSVSKEEATAAELKMVTERAVRAEGAVESLKESMAEAEAAIQERDRTLTERETSLAQREQALEAGEKKLQERNSKLLQDAHGVREELIKIQAFKEDEDRRKKALEQREKEVAVNATIREKAAAYDGLTAEYAALQQRLSDASGSQALEFARKVLEQALLAARDAVRGLGLELPPLSEGAEMSTVAGPCRGFEDLASCLNAAPPKLMEARVDDSRQFTRITTEDVLSTLLIYYPDLDMEVIRHGPIWSKKPFAEASVVDVADFIAENFDPEVGIIYPDSPSGRQIMPTGEDLEIAAWTGMRWTGAPWSGAPGGGNGSGTDGGSGSGSKHGGDPPPPAS
jgi:hypothetical protein